jgi:hypothetical protein
VAKAVICGDRFLTIIFFICYLLFRDSLGRDISMFAPGVFWCPFSFSSENDSRLGIRYARGITPLEKAIGRIGLKMPLI